ncbi:MAG TPA: transcriptional repressor [bacterium]|nr:transcriptional repressor [bacterium]
MEKPVKLKMTVQRRVILEEIQKVKTHPSADELYLAVRRRLPDISMATVYRNLETMAEHGLIRRLWEVGAPRRYDGELAEHYHILCERCGRVKDVSLQAVDGFLDEVRRASDYDVQGYRLGFFGLCPNCRQ